MNAIGTISPENHSPLVLCAQRCGTATPPYPDFITITKPVHHGFEKSDLTKRTDHWYQSKGQFSPIDLYHSERFKSISVKGSLPWYSQGHNLSFTLDKFEETIETISDSIKVKLREGAIKFLELSQVIPVNFPVKEILDNHRDLPGFERVKKQNSLYYNNYTRRGKE